ncbi:hypothetical protein J6590_018057 [Homalodisca vitripennis]|nr:hypothetical protein J6590_018057 [Homalodisca vitripennis]
MRPDMSASTSITACELLAGTIGNSAYEKHGISSGVAWGSVFDRNGITEGEAKQVRENLTGRCFNKEAYIRRLIVSLITWAMHHTIVRVSWRAKKSSRVSCCAPPPHQPPGGQPRLSNYAQQ